MPKTEYPYLLVSLIPESGLFRTRLDAATLLSERRFSPADKNFLQEFVSVAQPGDYWVSAAEDTIVFRCR